MTYRKDYLHESLTSQLLWHIQALDEQWEELVGRRSRLLEDLSMITSTYKSHGSVMYLNSVNLMDAGVDTS